MEERIQLLEKEIENIKARNQNVQAGKAWEQSRMRLLSIALITYLIASIVLYFIHVPNFYLSAVVPVIGYLLSVQSLPFLKDWWIKRYLEQEGTK
jgi:Flp pilus assembly protein TadB